MKQKIKRRVEKHSFFKSKYAALYKEDLTVLLGKDKADEIAGSAERIFNGLKARYPSLLKKERFHCYHNIFPVIAFYQSMNEHGVDTAMEILENGAAKLARDKGRLYGRIVSLPGMKGIFLMLFSIGAKKLFGESAGFCQEFLSEDISSLEFNITRCPYQCYCQRENLPELAHIFCKNDDYAYGNLPGVTFIRTTTLGTGGGLCDFKFRR